MFSSGEQMSLPQESFSLRAQGGQLVSDYVTGTLFGSLGFDGRGQQR